MTWRERRRGRRVKRDGALVYGWMRLDFDSGDLFGRRTGWFTVPLAEQTGLSPVRVLDAFRYLESAGLVDSGWVPGPSPRRRVYRVAD